jgi:excisionase family DNA binding protein
MAQQMMNQPGGFAGQSTPGIAAPAPSSAAAPSAAAPELFTPAQVAQQLGVSETDVLASLEAGDLKGKRIGSQWRITRAAVDAFLHS